MEENTPNASERNVVSLREAECRVLDDGTSQEEDAHGDDLSDGGSEGEESDDGSSGYRKSEDLPTCVCGYVSYGSDSDSSEDSDDWEDVRRRSQNNGGNLSRSYVHYISCSAKAPFPLAKLPPEVRLMVFRFAMPDDRARPLHSQESDWNDKYDCTHYDDYITVPERAKAIPTGLFRANKSISAEALSLFHNEFYFRMEVTPFGIHSRGHCTGHLENFDNHVELAKWRPFVNHRNYHLNIKSNAVRWASERGDVFRDPHNFKNSSERIKECLRLISDELSTRNIAQNLTLTAPCRCALKAARLVPADDAVVRDLLAPLRRIRVPNPVKITLHHDVDGCGIQHPCAKKACRALAGMLEESISALDGETLNHQEATWKELKALRQDDEEREKRESQQNGYGFFDRIDTGYMELYQVWECLNGRSMWESDTFEESVQRFHARRTTQDAKRQVRKQSLQKQTDPEAAS